MPCTPHVPFWVRALARLCGGGARVDQIQTSTIFQESKEAVWRRLLSYEEITLRPPWLLRTILPQPIRTTGDKARLFSDLQCTYRGGHLVKHLVTVDPPHCLRFEVTQQRLGIEPCLRALAGSYQLDSQGPHTRLLLTTQYLAKLRPRWLWRPIEHHLGHIFHRHLLNGMRHRNPPSQPSTSSTLGAHASLTRP